MMFKYLARVDNATIEDMCNFPNKASMFSLMFYTVIKHGFVIFSDHLLFIRITLLKLSDNVSGETRRNILVRKRQMNKIKFKTLFWSPAS